MKNSILFFCLVSFVGISCGWTKTLNSYGPFQIMLQMMIKNCDHNRNLDLNVSKIDVYFYDFSKHNIKRFTIDEAAEGILSYEELDENNTFEFFVGGFKSHIYKWAEERMKYTFRNVTNTYLIIYDHSPYTNDKQGSVKSYERSVRYVYYIGKAIGNMLSKLHQGGIPAKNMHCIGHSLGGQILASVGEVFTNNTEHKLSRITALDPAGPCFTNSLVENQIRSGVAEHVDIYHCNAGVLGTSNVLGDVNFFVNKGTSQPHCNNRWIPRFFESSTSAKCSHRACVDIWTATVHNPTWFEAYKCDSYDLYKSGGCSYNDRTIAGYWNPRNSSGVYIFSTKGYISK